MKALCHNKVHYYKILKTVLAPNKVIWIHKMDIKIFCVKNIAMLIRRIKSIIVRYSKTNKLWIWNFKTSIFYNKKIKTFIFRICKPT
jgi:hypothetical protein